MALGLAYIFFFNNPAQPLQLPLRHHGYPGAGDGDPLLHRQPPDGGDGLEADGPGVRVRLGLSEDAVLPDLRASITVPVCLPAILDISVYLFLNAMTTVSAVVFLYSTDTTLASVAVLNMDDQGELPFAAAMAMMIAYTCAGARILHAILTRGLQARTQAWRTR